MRDREISEQLWLLCDTEVEGGPEGVRALIAEMDRGELESVLAEAVAELLDATGRADKEIARYQRRLAKRSAKQA